jgi:hypothetical protein
MTSAKREDGGRAAKLRLVRPSAEPEQGASEAELALEWRQLRRALVAKIVDEHERTVATAGAPRASLVAPVLVGADAAVATNRASRDEPRWPLHAALIVGALSTVGYLAWAGVFAAEASAATQLLRAALAWPVIGALAASAALAVNVLVVHGNNRPPAPLARRTGGARPRAGARACPGAAADAPRARGKARERL